MSANLEQFNSFTTALAVITILLYGTVSRRRTTGKQKSCGIIVSNFLCYSMKFDVVKITEKYNFRNIKTKWNLYKNIIVNNKQIAFLGDDYNQH